MNQLHVYKHPLLPEYPSHPPPSYPSWSIELSPLYYTELPASDLFYTWSCICVNPALPICPTLPSPHCVRMSALYLCISIPALQVHLYHFSGFHIYALMYDICFCPLFSYYPVVFAALSFGVLLLLFVFVFSMPPLSEGRTSKPPKGVHDWGWVKRMLVLSATGSKGPSVSKCLQPYVGERKKFQSLLNFLQLLWRLKKKKKKKNCSK